MAPLILEGRIEPTHKVLKKKINSLRRRLISFQTKDANTRISICSNKQLHDQFHLIKEKHDSHSLGLNEMRLITTVDYI